MATIGQITYPSGETAEVDISDLPAGQSIFWIDDGEELTQVLIVTANDISIGASPASLALTTLSPTISLTLADRFKFPGPLKFWNGTAFVDAPFKSFDGSTLN